MKADGKLAKKIESADFIVTAELLPCASADGAAIDAAVKALGAGPVAINVSDNPYGVGTSSIAASVRVIKSGAEPICQIVTRDRNRMALQSDLLGAACLGIRNILCLSGYHQTLAGCPESSNVYDMDSTQWVELAAKMSEEGMLADGTTIGGPFSLLVGAVANPFLKPLELNLLRLKKKVDAGATFIQTHAVFDVETFHQWLSAAATEGITRKAAILAGVLPLGSAAEALKLRETYTDVCIPDKVVERLKAAGGDDAQKKAGLAMCVETIQKLKQMDGLKGVHLLSGGKEAVVPEIFAAAAL